jgi:hypothetical protein
MMTESELAELRALQRRAYGRDGALTPADAARLQELESSSAPEQVASAPSILAELPRAEASGAEVPRGVDSREAVDTLTDGASARDTPHEAQDSAAEEEPSEDAAAGAPPTWRSTLRRSWRLVAAASALLLAIGIGAGWMLFAPKGEDIPLSQEEVQRRTELATEGLYDDGSIRAIARKDDALVWYATKSERDEICLILDVGDRSQAGCAERDFDAAMSGLYTNLEIQGPVEGENGAYGGESVSAAGLYATNGELVVVIQRWDYDSSYLDQFEGDDRTRAEELIDEGYEHGLSVLGYFRDEPIWFAQRFTEGGTVERCVIVDAVEDAAGCVPDDGDASAALSVVSFDPDGTGWTITVEFTGWGSPYLTITEGAEA